MNKTMPNEKQKFAEQLVAAGIESSHSESSQSESDRDRLLNELLNREKAFESNLGKVALVAWAVALGALVVFSVAVTLSRNGGGVVESVGRMAVMVTVPVGVIGLVIGLMATMCWLFRSRTASLAVIERRLAALEVLLKDLKH